MIKMRKKFLTVRTVPKSNQKIVKTETKAIPLTRIHMIVHFHGFVQTLQ